MRDTVIYLVDRVEWPTFYLELSKFANVFKKLRDNEMTVSEILDRWTKREYELSIMCTEVVGLPKVSRIEKVFY